MFFHSVQQKVNQWLSLPDCPALPVINYIRERGALRTTQIEAIATYLFLKIAGEGKPLAALFAAGFFNQPCDLTTAPISQIARERLQADPGALALFQLCESIDRQSRTRRTNSLATTFERHLTANADDKAFAASFREIFYQANYPDYLFSLPMGAGKTFLMAAFICLDLYFAQLEPENPAFARNFIVLIPSGLKSSIIPSLRTIEHFDPSWVLPQPAASDIRQQIKFEVLDQPRSARKSNRARNPNAQKVAAHQPFDSLTGLVMVVNAEKVILDRVEVDDNFTLIERNEEEQERLANELRHLIGTIPRLQIFIDEVQRAADGDIKLRAVVNKWCESRNISTVLGFSGTPYHDKVRTVDVGPVALRTSTIANTVYYYPLATAIAHFLKKPRLEVATGLSSLEIVRQGVVRFMEEYGGKRYGSGACAKLAIYCGSIARLEEEIYPLLVGDIGIPANRILRYHQGNKSHPIHRNAAADFALLDAPDSPFQIILLVQIGKEGWDCRSLTGVILAQEGDCPRNMVLQTSCRCLRQVDPNTSETAYILLNDGNATILDRQLGEEQNTSIAELNAIQAEEEQPTITQRSRMEYLRLPGITFYQLQIDWQTLQLGAQPVPAAALHDFDPDMPLYKTSATLTARYLDERQAQQMGQQSTIREVKLLYEERGTLALFADWLNQLVREGMGEPDAGELRSHHEALAGIFAKITTSAGGQRYYNRLYDQAAIRSAIRMAFRQRRHLETHEEVIRQEADLLLVDKLRSLPEDPLLWPGRSECEAILRSDANPQAGTTDPVELEARKEQLQQTARDFNNPDLADLWIRDLLRQETETVAARQRYNRTLHYLPYDFRQSAFERDFMTDAITLADVREAALELYYNGDRSLTSFKIDCYARTGRTWRRVGYYTPDFLLLRRDGSNAIKQVLILETKGAGFADQVDFVARRNFMENEFIRRNNEKFGYNRFAWLPLFENDGRDYNRQQLAAKIREFFHVH